MKQLIMAAGLAVMLTACGTSEKKTVEGENPFFAEYTTRLEFHLLIKSSSSTTNRPYCKEWKRDARRSRRS